MRTTSTTAPAATVQQTAQSFRALGDPTRMRILELLAGGERCVCELTGVLDLPQPLLSHHLKTLREAGFLHVRKEGRWMYYRLDPERLEACICALEEALARYDAAAADGKPGCACR